MHQTSLEGPKTQNSTSSSSKALSLNFVVFPFDSHSNDCVCRQKICNGEIFWIAFNYQNSCHCFLFVLGNFSEEKWLKLCYETSKRITEKNIFKWICCKILRSYNHKKINNETIPFKERKERLNWVHREDKFVFEIVVVIGTLFDTFESQREQAKGTYLIYKFILPNGKIACLQLHWLTENIRIRISSRCCFDNVNKIQAWRSNSSKTSEIHTKKKTQRRNCIRRSHKAIIG